MNIGKAPKSTAKTPIGKFKRDLIKFSRNKIESYSPELLPLYDWYNQMDKRQIDYLLELKNVYSVLQEAALPSLIDKIHHGEQLNKKDLDALKLIKEILVESHKLKYGDKHVVENIVTYKDVVKQLKSDKTIIDAEVLNVTQNMDRSGSIKGSKHNGNESGNPKPSKEP